MLPEAKRPGGVAMSRRIAMALTDLPHPDSPTSASVSPERISNDIPSTARTGPASVSK
ncbi:MAG: hypothetical protein BWZ10_01721 [candidate division BRC1 bacterium ADurb.BinA364]|nr:MAG: hypothetical protein BWZ10_01721 [candidate division BRC1 bacterium ADurb.BinA364]